MSTCWPNVHWWPDPVDKNSLEGLQDSHNEKRMMKEIKDLNQELTKILKYRFLYLIRNLGINTLFPNLEIGSLYYSACGNRFPW